MEVTYEKSKYKISKNEKKIAIKRCIQFKNISPGFYCLLENGLRKPSLKAARNISNALGITLDEFYQALVITISQFK